MGKKVFSLQKKGGKVFVSKGQKASQKNWLKNKEHEKIYNLQRWRKMRKAIIEADPVCSVVNCTRPAFFLDHIIPISNGGSVWDRDNLQGLCKSCNAKKTAAQSKKNYNS